MVIEKTEEKRFIFHLNYRIHQEVKVRSARRNMSMAKWITEAIMERIKKEQTYEVK